MQVEMGLYKSVWIFGVPFCKEELIGKGQLWGEGHGRGMVLYAFMPTQSWALKFWKIPAAVLFFQGPFPLVLHSMVVALLLSRVSNTS